jgi:hypothetical protein
VLKLLTTHCQIREVYQVFKRFNDIVEIYRQITYEYHGFMEVIYFHVSTDKILFNTSVMLEVSQ